MSDFLKVALPFAAPLATAMFAPSSFAEGSLGFTVEEIVVTAQRREQSLQDVPVSISALDSDTLERNGVAGLHDIGNLMPGVTIGNSQSARSTSSIRGIQSNAFGFGLEESVPFYLDGVYLGSGFSTLGELMDIQQIEVLKGPQGTLFGRNASAGAINVRTVRPSDELEGEVSLNVGNYGLLTTKLSGNAPLMDDRLLIRGGVSKTERDGWQLNTETGDRDGYEMDRQSAYVKGVFLASDDVEVEFSADWSDQDDHSGYFSIAEANSTFSPIYAAFANPYSFSSSSGTSGNYAAASNGFYTNYGFGVTAVAPADEVDSRNKKEIRGASVKVTWDVNDESTFTSVTSYRESTGYLGTDGDGSNLGLVNSVQETSIEEINQEFRFSVSNDLADWFVGFNAYRQDFRADRTVSLSGMIPAARLAPILFSAGVTPAAVAALHAASNTALTEVSSGENATSSYGLYSDVIWHLSDRMNLTVGARYTYDEKEFEQLATDNNTYLGDGLLFPNLDQLANPEDYKVSDSWGNLSGRIVLDYALTDTSLAYVSLAQGYKSGGFNTARTVELTSGGFRYPEGASEPFEEETNVNFELGYKSTLMDNRLRFNTSLFAYEYSDLQFLLSDASSPITQTINASKVNGYGLDTDILFAATENLSVFANIAYMQAEYGEDVLDASGAVRVEQGSETPMTPELSGTIGFDLRTHLEGVGELRGNLSYTYTGSHLQSNIDITQDFSDSTNASGAYSVVNGRISLLTLDDAFEVAVWGKNITNEYYAHTVTGTASSTAGVMTHVPAEPRTYGVSLAYSF